LSFEPTVTSAIELAITSSAAPAPAAASGFSGRSNPAMRNSGSFAAMCASQLSSPPANETTPPVPTPSLSGSQKPASKATAIDSLSAKNSATTDTPIVFPAVLATLLPMLVPAPVAPALTSSPALPQSGADLSSSPSVGANAANPETTGSSQLPQATSPGFPPPVPATEPSVNTALTALWPDGAIPVASDGPSREAAATQAPRAPMPQPENNPQPAQSAEPNSQNQVVCSVLTGSLTAESIPSLQNVDQPAACVALPTAVSFLNRGPASQVAVSSAGGDSIPSAPGIARPGSFGSGSTASESVSLPVQSDSTREVPASPDFAEAPSSKGATAGNDEPMSALAPAVLAPALPTPLIARSDLEQPVVPQPSPATLQVPAKQDLTPAQIFLNALHTLVNNPAAHSSDPLRPTPPPAYASLPATQTESSSASVSVVPFPSVLVPAPFPAPSANLSPDKGSSLGKNSFPPFSAESPILSSAPVETVAVSAVENNSQSGTSGDGTSNPSQHKQAAEAAVQTGALPATPPQAGAVALADPAMQAAMQNSTSPPATPGAAHKADGSVPAGSPDPPAARTASGELPLGPSGPVQMAQMVDKAAQSEMRIGLNTSAFGNVEVRTVVHANEVGVMIGSEKGDLRSLLSNELPGIANSLQQQNLRLNQVNFHQQGFAFSNQTSSGSDSQRRFFASKPANTTAPPAEMTSAESSEPADRSSAAGARGLSILA
jgi:hypothetical protein